MKKSLYVGCALRSATPEFITSVADFKASLKNKFEVIDFVGLNPDVSAQEVYEKDIACAAKADIMLAICTEPSTGLGMELQKRIELKKETYVAYPRTVNISRMVTGAASSCDFVHEIAFTNLEEVVNMIKA